MAKKILITSSTEKTKKQLIIEAINEISKMILDDKYPYQKYLVTFKNPTTITHSSRNVKKETAIALSFFTGTSGALCYSCRLNPRRGYYVTSEMFENMESIEIFTEAELCPDKKIKHFIGKFHPNLWSNIVEELNADPNVIRTKYYGNLSTTNISSKFPKHVIQELKTAIENRKDYSYRSYGSKRDLSVETKLGDDGVYRGWFSSEFAGCGNGTYYLLINPTTAAFKEDD